MNSSVPAVILENPSLRVILLPTLGGKIASLQIKRLDLELLQTPLQPYQPRTLQQSFEDSDASGADDCLPSVAACVLDWNGQRHPIPDHGDVWRLPCEFTKTDNAITLSGELSSLPLRLERQITLLDHSVQFRYKISNISSSSVPYLWSAHPLFTAEAGDRILLPGSIQALMLESSMQNRLGQRGDRISWPHAPNPHGQPADLSMTLGPKSAVGDKLFADLSLHGSNTFACGLYRVQHQVGISLAFSPEQIPFLGLWLCYGGWPLDRSLRQQCVALEPCTCPSDSLAQAVDLKIAPILVSGCSVEWVLHWLVLGAEQPVSYQEFEGAITNPAPMRG